MAEAIRVGIIGGGWPGKKHASGYQAAGGWKITAVADLIPQRRKAIMDEFGAAKEFSDALELIADKEIDAVSICLPNFLHAPTAIAALKAGKHVLCEKPPAMDAAEARRIETAGNKAQKIVLYSVQRRFGGSEQAAHQAIAKGYAGDPYHARASWTRTRGIPAGTGWFTDKSKSGGGAMIDIGVHMLDLAWYLLGQPQPQSVFAVTHRRLSQEKPPKPTPPPSSDSAAPQVAPADPAAPTEVEDAGFALIRFAGNKSLELAATWALNQAPQQNGTICRIHGDRGAVEVYTPQGSILYRGFDPKGEAKATPLKLPKTTGHTALCRHFRECILGKSKPLIGAHEGVLLMEMLDGIYKSAESGRSVAIKA